MVPPHTNIAQGAPFVASRTDILISSPAAGCILGSADRSSGCLAPALPDLPSPIRQQARKVPRAQPRGAQAVSFSPATARGPPPVPWGATAWLSATLLTARPARPLRRDLPVLRGCLPAVILLRPVVSQCIRRDVSVWHLDCKVTGVAPAHVSSLPAPYSFARPGPAPGCLGACALLP